MNTSTEELTADLYEQWRRHPITVMALRNIQKHRDLTVASISSSAMASNVDDASIRHQACSLRNTDALLTMLTRFDLFVQQTKK